MKKSLMIGLAIALTVGTVSPVQAKQSQVPVVNCTVKVGENKKVKLPKVYQKEGINLSSISYPIQNTGLVEQQTRNGVMTIHGISKGSYRMQVAFSGANDLVVNVKVTGEPNKPVKGLSKLYGVQKSASSGSFQYKTCYLDPMDYDGDNKFDCIYFKSCEIKNVSKKTKKTDAKIKFYNKEKKVVGTYQLLKDKGANVNTSLKAGSSEYAFVCGIGAESLGVTDKKFKTIKYWKVCKL